MTEISLEASIDDIVVSKQTKGGYFPVTLMSSRGDVKCRYYHSAGEKKAVIFVGGVGGGFNSPAGNLYPQLCHTLNLHNISSLRIKFRYPSDLVESVVDVMIGITFLERFGIEEICLVGHSLGGAVVIQAGAAAPETVSTIVTLATQAHGAEVASILEDTSLLLIHGSDDKVMPVYSSTYIHDITPGEKQLLLYKGATHGLDEVSQNVRKEIKDWLLDHLK
jgi:pimeloyl-ACP methyl ester carboxylesterase